MHTPAAAAAAASAVGDGAAAAAAAAATPGDAAASAARASMSSPGFFGDHPSTTAKDYARPEHMPRCLPMHTWWQEHADKPLYPGARVNNMDAVYKLISIWNEHSMTNAAFNDILGFMTEFALPQVSCCIGMLFAVVTCIL
jgi:hypothetical protein